MSSTDDWENPIHALAGQTQQTLIQPVCDRGEEICLALDSSLNTV